MKRIFSHLKPFVLLIVLTVGMLFVQAFSDLKLPNYMSNIVNVGIQQSGVEHASPEKISQDGLDFIVVLSPKEKQTILRDSYVLDSQTKQLLLKENIDREKLDLIFGEAAWTMLYHFESLDKGSLSEGFDLEENKNFDMKELYAMTPYFSTQDLSQDQAKAAAMEDSLKRQTGLWFAQGFYEELGEDLSNLQQSYIQKTGVQMMLVTFVGMIATIGVSFVSSRIGSGFAKNLRRDLFEKIQGFVGGELDEFSASSLVVRTSNDINQIQQVLLMSLRMFFYAPVMAIGGVVMILRQGANLTWILLMSILALSILLLVIFFLAVPRFELIQKISDRLNQVFRENLSGVMVVRAFDNHAFEAKRFDKVNKERADINLFLNRIMALMMPLMMLIMNLTILSIIWFGSHEISEGLLQIGDMMAFMQYTMQVIFSFLMISMMFIFIPRAVVSLKRVAEVFNTEYSVLDPETPVEFDEKNRGLVEFDNVCFRYEGAEQYVLENISFSVRPGETLAIIGSTGSGKSTLINLIPRFYDVEKGSVKVNGVDVRDYDQKTLRDQIAYIPQQGILHSGTVWDNLTYGRPEASKEEVEKALEIAQATFVLKEGFDMPIAQGGTNVSGGQRQRISIARAIVKNAPIYIFDDSFSALDFKTDRKLREELDKNMKDASRIVVAQRVNTIMDADQIIVLDKGKVVGKGKHFELLENCPTYYEIASSQLSEEELAYGK